MFDLFVLRQLMQMLTGFGSGASALSGRSKPALELTPPKTLKKRCN